MPWLSAMEAPSKNPYSGNFFCLLRCRYVCCPEDIGNQHKNSFHAPISIAGGGRLSRKFLCANAPCSERYCFFQEAFSGASPCVPSRLLRNVALYESPQV